MSLFTYTVKNKIETAFKYTESTVNSEIFARILFSRIALKDIFATLKFATSA